MLCTPNDQLVQSRLDKSCRRATPAATSASNCQRASPKHRPRHWLWPQQWRWHQRMQPRCRRQRRTHWRRLQRAARGRKTAERCRQVAWVRLAPQRGGSSKKFVNISHLQKAQRPEAEPPSPLRMWGQAGGREASTLSCPSLTRGCGSRDALLHSRGQGAAERLRLAGAALVRSSGKGRGRGGGKGLGDGGGCVEGDESSSSKHILNRTNRK